MIKVRRLGRLHRLHRTIPISQCKALYMAIRATHEAEEAGEGADVEVKATIRDDLLRPTNAAAVAHAVHIQNLMRKRRVMEEEQAVAAVEALTRIPTIPITDTVSSKRLAL